MYSNSNYALKSNKQYYKPKYPRTYGLKGGESTNIKGSDNNYLPEPTDMKNTTKQEEKQIVAAQVNTLDFAPDTVELIKKTIAVGATDDELQLFLYQAKRTGLDPLARQIYFVKRGGKVVIQTSIDGFRVIAGRNTDYAGQDEPVFTENGNGHPTVAKVKVYKFRGDMRYLAATGVAHWSEYVPQAGQDFMWKKMPHTMLAKVAEALALRKAFPQDLSGIYSDEEMQQSERFEPIKPELANDVQKKKIFALAKGVGKDAEEVKETLKAHFHLNSFNDITKGQANAAIEKLSRMIEEQASDGDTFQSHQDREETLDAESIAESAHQALG